MQAKHVTLSKHQLAALQIQNTIMSLQSFTWMEKLFDLVGDDMPSCGEVHLEPMNIQEIYDEYVLKFGCLELQYLVYVSFLKLWDFCFNRVKVRLHIPFLLRNTTNETFNKPQSDGYLPRSRTSKALSSLKCIGSGVTRSRNDLSARQSTEFMKGPPGISSSCPIDLHVENNYVKKIEAFECDCVGESDSERDETEDEYVVLLSQLVYL